MRIMAKTAARKSNAGGTPLSLKVTLRDTKPPVWRRLLVPGEMTLGDLHQAIQAAMGWDDAHLHAFDIAGREYGDPDSVDDVADEERLSLNAVLKSGVRRFTYTYDFGDNWEHMVLIERPRRPLEAGSYPACLAGQRHCPPEDCGGSWGYQELLAVLADPTHPDYPERVEWVGEDFDPEEFSVDVANARLATRFGRT
jgi:Plasmid pRiA4b ORF-3-like protein